MQVVVGKDNPKTFHVHKGLLTHYSEYFACAIGNANWMESDGVVRLDHDDPETFQLFYNFIYTGRVTDNARLTPHIGYLIEQNTRPVRIKITETETYVGAKSRDDAVPLSFASLVKLADFADMRVVPILWDVVNSLVVQKISSEAYVPLDLIEGIMEQRTPQRGLQHIVLDTFLMLVSKTDFQLYRNCLPPAFLANLALAQMDFYNDTREKSTSFETQSFWSTCAFHNSYCNEIGVAVRTVSIGLSFLWYRD